MRYLLDTHTLLWLAYEDERLSPRVARIFQQRSNEIVVSAASAWEIATKHRLGKLSVAGTLVENFIARVTAAGMTFLSISVEHALRAGRMPGEHRDPFDRMLAAQAVHEDMPILSNDLCFDSFSVRRIW